MHTSSPSRQLVHAAGRILLAAAALSCTLLPAAASASPLDWISGERVQGSGTVKKQQRNLAHFTGVALSLPGQLEIRIGNTESVTIETDDNLLPLIESDIDNGVLRLRPVKRSMNLQPRTLRIVVTARTIDSLWLGGSGSIESDALRSDKLALDIGGSGSIHLKAMEGESATVTIGGSGSLRSGPGSVKRIAISIGGSGDVDLGQVKADAVTVTVGGSGMATVAPANTLSATIAGSGGVKYYGDPTISKTIAGSGGLRRLGDAPR